MKESCDVIDIIDSLESGEIISFKTDTLFSLSCDATNTQSVYKIYEMKGRSIEKALPIFVGSIEQAAELALFDDNALRLAEAFWPGALTLVLPLKEPTCISPLVYRNERSIALRIPKDPLILDVLNQYQKPLVATSANLSGQSTPHSAEGIKQLFGQKISVFARDSNFTLAANPSTIIKINRDGAMVLRDGGISQNDLNMFLNSNTAKKK